MPKKWQKLYFYEIYFPFLFILFSLEGLDTFLTKISTKLLGVNRCGHQDYLEILTTDTEILQNDQQKVGKNILLVNLIDYHVRDLIQIPKSKRKPLSFF